MADVERVRVIFLDVGNSNIGTTKTGGVKGDAILVDCDGEYVLIDGGRGGTRHTELRAALNKHCYKTKNNEIILRAVIVTHYHPDHYSGLKSILNTPKYKDYPKIIVNNIWRTDLYDHNKGKSGKEEDNPYSYNAMMDTLKHEKTIKSHVLTTEKVTDNLGDKISVIRRIQLRGVNIDLYSPPKEFRTKDKNGNFDTPTEKYVSILNNSSIIVKVSYNNKNILLMGDMTWPGIEAAINEYSRTRIVNGNKEYVYGNQALFTGNDNIRICKYGHHGLRGTASPKESDDMSKSFRREIAMYNNYVKATTYVFTPAENERHPKDPAEEKYDAEKNVTYNFKILEKELKDKNGNPSTIKYTFDSYYPYTLYKKE